MARKRTPLSTDDLLAAISAAEESAIGIANSTIATERADAIARYLGKQYAGELAPAEGRSSVVSRDVADVIDGVLANVIKPFVGGDDVVTFNPMGPDDEERAKQESDYVNFVVNERNNGFLVLNAAIKDALLLRSGYVKCGWTKRSDVVVENYTEQSDEELAMLMNDADVEIVEHTEYPLPDPTMMEGQAPTLHDVKVRRARPTEFVCTDPCPPEELLVSQRTRTVGLQESDFVQHRTRKTLSEIRQMGYDVPDDINDDDNSQTLEDYARERNVGMNLYDDDTQDMARRMVMFKETWIRIDRDGDGIAELRRVCQVGDTLLADDETDVVPVAPFCALLMPHQHVGISVYDMVEDLARLKTALMRAFMDNKYLANNIQWAVDAERANIDDFLISRPGGVKRGRGNPNEWVTPVATPDTGPSALQGLEYLDAVRENRTGYTRQTQGLKTDALVTETVGGMLMQLTQSQLRLEMIARTIAETGVRELYRIVHALTLKHSTRADKVRINNKWIEIDPRQWVKRQDLSIAVGIGSASQQQMMASLTMIGQAQEKVIPLGLAKPDNIYNTLKKMVNAAGFKNVDEFFTAPEPNPQTGKVEMPPSPPNPAVQIEQMKQQGAAQMAQFEAQQSAQKLAMEGQIKQQELAASLELQRSNDMRQSQLDQQKAELEANARAQEMALERYKIELETAAKKEIEQAKIQAQFAIEQMRQQHASETQDKQNAAEANKGGEAKQLDQLFLPRTVLRDERGKVVGVNHGGVIHEVVRDELGRVAGMRPKTQEPKTIQ